MNLQEFKNSLSDEMPPADLSTSLQAMWFAGKGDWEQSHDLCQDTNLELDWVHAWLHRQEGDLPNANYWYRRANQVMPDVTLEQEWDDISAALLSANPS